MVNLVAGASSREKAARLLSVRYLPRSRFGCTFSVVGKAAATTSLMSFTLILSLIMYCYWFLKTFIRLWRRIDSPHSTIDVLWLLYLLSHFSVALLGSAQIPTWSVVHSRDVQTKPYHDPQGRSAENPMEPFISHDLPR